MANDNSDNWKKIVGAAEAILGAAFVMRGLRAAFGDPPTTPLLGTRLSGAMSSGTIVRKGEIHTLPKGGSIDDRVRFIAEMTRRSSVYPQTREDAMAVLTRKCAGGTRWCVREKDDKAEVMALFDAVRRVDSPLAVRYTGDHVYVDQFQHYRVTRQTHAGDCFVKGTLVLKSDHTLAAIDSLRVGDRIWGLDKWSTVTRTWEKGVLPTWNVKLNNGSTMRLTPDHKVWVASCPRHKGRCSCAQEGRSLERMTVRELQPGMVLTQPEKIPFGNDPQDADRAHVEGLYVSDGWASPKQKGAKLSDFCISGQDGCPKEEQKRVVQELCAGWGIPTYWNRKYLGVKDPEWATRLAALGQHAPSKILPSLSWNEAAARALWLGVMADSGKNTNGPGRTFTTTSHELFVQMRVLSKMLGVTCGARYIEKHGGLGKNPIWRLQMRARPKMLRVQSVRRDDVEQHCFDIETDDHFVWLPEADWTTSQCDDQVVYLGSLLMTVGFHIRLRVVHTVGDRTWNHIYFLVGLPRLSPTRWMPLDLTVKSKPAGWEVPGASECARTGRPAGQVEAVKDFDMDPLTKKELE